MVEWTGKPIFYSLGDRYALLIGARHYKFSPAGEIIGLEEVTQQIVDKLRAAENPRLKGFSQAAAAGRRSRREIRAVPREKR